MKIISKYKDYYDYLTGVYGIDDKLVLDRRDNDLLPYSINFYTFYIAGYVIEGIYDENKGFIYGKDLNSFRQSKSKYLKYLLSKHEDRDYDKSISIKYKASYGVEEDWVYTGPIKDKDCINTTKNCPVILKFNNRYLRYPKLDSFNIPSFVNAEIIYKWLTEWLGNQITLKEQSKELDNDLKITSKGFDNKTSFRPKMRKND